MMLTITLCLYLLGILLVLSLFEVEDGSSSLGLIALAVGWPLLAVHLALCDIFYPDEQ
jgi:hypothetical protein